MCPLHPLETKADIPAKHPIKTSIHHVASMRLRGGSLFDKQKCTRLLLVATVARVEPGRPQISIQRQRQAKSRQWLKAGQAVDQQYTGAGKQERHPFQQ